jgi:hypothetical protein
MASKNYNPPYTSYQNICIDAGRNEWCKVPVSSISSCQDIIDEIINRNPNIEDIEWKTIASMDEMDIPVSD